MDTMKKLSSEEKARRVVPAQVPPEQRQAVVEAATSRIKLSVSAFDGEED